MALSSLLVIITITKPCNDRRHGQFDTLRHQIKERVSLYKPIILISSVLLPRSSVKASADLKNARYKGCIRVTNRHKWSYLLVHTDCLFISMSRHSLFTKVSASIKVSWSNRRQNLVWVQIKTNHECCKGGTNRKRPPSVSGKWWWTVLRAQRVSIILNLYVLSDCSYWHCQKSLVAKKQQEKAFSSTRTCLWKCEMANRHTKKTHSYFFMMMNTASAPTSKVTRDKKKSAFQCRLCSNHCSKAPGALLQTKVTQKKHPHHHDYHAKSSVLVLLLSVWASIKTALLLTRQMSEQWRERECKKHFRREAKPLSRAFSSWHFNGKIRKIAHNTHN